MSSEVPEAVLEPGGICFLRSGFTISEMYRCMSGPNPVGNTSRLKRVMTAEKWPQTCYDSEKLAESNASSEVPQLGFTLPFSV